MLYVHFSIGIILILLCELGSLLYGFSARDYSMFLLVIIKYIWAFSGIYFISLMAQWYFETEVWYTEILAGALALILLQLPILNLVVMGLLFYYLAFVRDWNIFLTILYMFPGLIWFIASLPILVYWSRKRNSNH